ncbi:MAG: hypothetical protein RMK74_01060 [Myxococcales bacterium]|nr:hypothetical protein [Myxococcales bacterium]
MSDRLRCLVALVGAAVTGCDADAGPGHHHHHHHHVPDAGVEDAGPFTGPARLSETGLYADLRAGALAEGVLPYRVRHELWSDGSDKSRFLWLPPGTHIDATDPDAWRFPIGTRVWKEFRVDGKRIETRFMEKTGDGSDPWLRVAYVWNAEQTEAFAAPDGERDAGGSAHDVPSRAQCRVCHRGAADDLLGVSLYQVGAPDGDGTLRRLVASGRIVPSLEPRAIPGEPAAREALGYLHANCGHCHGDRHPLGAYVALRLAVPAGLERVEDAPVYATAIGRRAGHVVDGLDTIVVPGSPDRSQLVARMQTRRPEHQMPPLATERVDETGVGLVRAWIASLPRR